MTTSHTATIVTMAAASIVMAGLTLTSVASPYRAPLVAATADTVYQLPRVVVIGQMQQANVAQVVELPRVVVTGRRTQVAPTVVTQDDAAQGPQRS
jgi:hypothetical protein